MVQIYLEHLWRLRRPLRSLVLDMRRFMCAQIIASSIGKTRNMMTSVQNVELQDGKISQINIINKKGKRKATLNKVLCYFPIKPRLKRLFHEQGNSQVN